MPTKGDLHLVDTSVAVPYVLAQHPLHEDIWAALAGLDVGLSGHAVFETYSVLTRLAPPHRVSSADAARVIGANFPATRHLSEAGAGVAPERLALAGVAGGAVYDGLVGLAAIEHGASLLTCDRRALPTYAALGASVELLAGD